MVRDRILRLFFENPTKEFQIRRMAKLLKAPKSSVNYHIQQLLRDGIIIKKEQGVFPCYAANETGEKYRFHKRESALKRIIDSGLLNFLEEKTNPRCIVLFGSFAKAEYDENSDIDFFVQANEKTVDLAKFEKKLKHTINVMFEPDLNKLSSELLNNIINGIKLRGYIKIK